MKTIQIRNVPDRVHRVLRARAAAAGVSLSDYALEELVRLAEHPPVADLLARARARAGGARAEAIVERVQGDELVAEIVRMLGAGRGDEAASRHARELLAAA